MSSLNRRVARLALGDALVLPLLPTAASAADTWSPPQTLASAPATNPSTALAETADGTLVAITLGADGTFRRSSRAPGEDWVPSGAFADPDGLALEFVNAVAVTRDGAGWLAYTVEDAEAGGRTLDRPGAGLADQVSAAIAPAGPDRAGESWT